MNDLLRTKPKSLREKLAQLIFVRIGSNLPPVRTVEQDAERIANLLQECPVGGLLLFNGRRGETAHTLADLQSQSQYPLLVASDIERGVGQQILGHTMFPHAMAFDALGEEAEQAVRQFAKCTAIMARANGIHITFAPVADVNIDPRNPIISTRAFGSEPGRVSQLVKVFVESCQSEGLLATAKHFPGHGNTHEDSHSMLPRVESTRDELEACELAPFRAAIAAQVALVMTAHVQYPGLDDSGKPATLSAPILTNLLRSKLGFQGAVASDSLLMEGVKREAADEGTLAVEAINAGVDLLLDVADPIATLDALERAVLQQQLAEARAEQAFERLWRLKELAFRERDASAALVPLDTQQPTETGESLAAELALDDARRAVTVVCDEQSLLPLASDRSLLAVLLKPFETNLDAPEQPLAEALCERFARSTYFELGPSCEQATLEEILHCARSAEQLLIAMIVKPAAWHRFGLDEKHKTLLQQLLQHPGCVLASLGTPEALKPFANAGVQICAYSDVPVSQRALAERLIAAN
ncbi:MAG: hypothetical protein KDA57_14550 [Planctomycetales bacterium]|nr:hypothetical protein [Planctomycetales bacterium]